MAEAAAALAAQLAALGEQFVTQLGRTFDEFDAGVRDQDACVAREQLQAIHARLHQLAGSGGTFGFSELSRRARALEVTAQSWLESAVAVPPADWLAWRDALLALRQSVVKVSPADAVPASPDALAPSPNTKEQIRIALIDDHAGGALELKRGLGQFGYEVTLFTDLARAEWSLRDDPSVILLADMKTVVPEPGRAGSALSGALPALGGAKRLLILMAESPDARLLLLAAQAGADACLVKPVDAPTVAARIEALVRERDQPPYRVLVVDDDEALAEHYRLVLSAAGMLAEHVSDPMAVWPALERLRPDLLLMDLYMPSCSGADLARAIRYDEAWQSLPIVYLSAESDLNHQAVAMSRGADDFLLKPITDMQLVSSVRARARRARTLDELMSQDSLTGLLKHGNIKDRLAQEVDRANRQGTAMTVAMVDIDFFKKVNDSWGHPMGDQVIKTLGHLLRQRLRRQDSVGRYGGEEFVAVLPECSADDAMRLLDDIRQRFAEVSFGSQGAGFSVTYSAGIACNEQFRSPSELLAAADAALYEAKHGGRNQVRLAT